MILSDGRRQKENCKGRQFSWQFTWKTAPVPQGALKIFAWGLTFMPVSVHSHWNTSPGNRLKKIAKEGDVAGEGEGKSSAAVQFKTTAGPLLPSHVNCSPFSQPGSLQNYTFPSSNGTKHSLTSESYRFPSFSFLKYQAGRLTNEGLLATLAVRPRCVFTQGHRKFFWRYAVLSAAPLPDTPIISCVLD